MKKIVLITGNTKGGIIQFLETVKTELENFGFQVIVVAPAEVEKKLQDKKNFIYYQSCASSVRFVDRVLYFLSRSKILNEISKEVTKLNADLIWLVDNPRVTVKMGLKLTSANAPILLTLHDAGESHPTNETKYQKVRRVYTHLLSDILEKKVEHILLLSKASFEKYSLLKPLNKSKVVYFCLGAHVPNAEEIKPDEVTEDEFHLFFGRIDKYKGIGTLLKTFSEVDNNKYKLVIAGSGKLSQDEVELYNQLGSKVTLINRYISDEEMVWLFHHARSTILPYIEATQSGIIPIAYKFGVPVITSDIEGLTQFVVNGETGFICKREKDYIESLQKIENNDVRNALSEKAIAYHLRHMDWEKNILSILDAVLDQSNKAN